MDWLPLITVAILINCIAGESLKCGEDIVIKKGQKRILRFWSSEDELLNVDVLPKPISEGTNSGSRPTDQSSGGSSGVLADRTTSLKPLLSSTTSSSSERGSSETNKLRSDIDSIQNDEGANREEENSLYYSQNTLEANRPTGITLENNPQRKETDSQEESSTEPNEISGTNNISKETQGIDNSPNNEASNNEEEIYVTTLRSWIKPEKGHTNSKRPEQQLEANKEDHKPQSDSQLHSSQIDQGIKLEDKSQRKETDSQEESSTEPNDISETNNISKETQVIDDSSSNEASTNEEEIYVTTLRSWIQPEKGQKNSIRPEQQPTANKEDHKHQSDSQLHLSQTGQQTDDIKTTLNPFISISNKDDSNSDPDDFESSTTVDENLNQENMIYSTDSYNDESTEKTDNSNVEATTVLDNYPNIIDIIANFVSTTYASYNEDEDLSTTENTFHAQDNFDNIKTNATEKGIEEEEKEEEYHTQNILESFATTTYSPNPNHHDSDLIENETEGVKNSMSILESSTSKTADDTETSTDILGINFQNPFTSNNNIKQGPPLVSGNKLFRIDLLESMENDVSQEISDMYETTIGNLEITTLPYADIDYTESPEIPNNTKLPISNDQSSEKVNTEINHNNNNENNEESTIGPEQNTGITQTKATTPNSNISHEQDNLNSQNEIKAGDINHIKIDKEESSTVSEQLEISTVSENDNTSQEVTTTSFIDSLGNNNLVGIADDTVDNTNENDVSTDDTTDKILTTNNEHNTSANTNLIQLPEDTESDINVDNTNLPIDNDQSNVNVNTEIDHNISIMESEESTIEPELTTGTSQTKGTTSNNNIIHSMNFNSHNEINAGDINQMNMDKEESSTDNIFKVNEDFNISQEVTTTRFIDSLENNNLLGIDDDTVNNTNENNDINVSTEDTTDKVPATNSENNTSANTNFIQPPEDTESDTNVDSSLDDILSDLDDDEDNDIFASIIDSWTDALEDLPDEIPISVDDLVIDISQFLDITPDNLLPVVDENYNKSSHELPVEHRDPELPSTIEDVNENSMEVTTEIDIINLISDINSQAMAGFIDTNPTEEQNDSSLKQDSTISYEEPFTETATEISLDIITQPLLNKKDESTTIEYWEDSGDSKITTDTIVEDEKEMPSLTTNMPVDTTTNTPTNNHNLDLIYPDLNTESHLLTTVSPLIDNDMDENINTDTIISPRDDLFGIHNYEEDISTTNDNLFETQTEVPNEIGIATTPTYLSVIGDTSKHNIRDISTTINSLDETQTDSTDEIISTTPNSFSVTKDSAKNSTTDIFTVPLLILNNQAMLDNLINGQKQNDNREVIIQEQGSKVAINTPAQNVIYLPNNIGTDENSSSSTNNGQLTTPMDSFVQNTYETTQNSTAKITTQSAVIVNESQVGISSPLPSTKISLFDEEYYTTSPIVSIITTVETISDSNTDDDNYHTKSTPSKNPPNSEVNNTNDNKEMGIENIFETQKHTQLIVDTTEPFWNAMSHELDNVVSYIQRKTVTPLSLHSQNNVITTTNEPNISTENASELDRISQIDDKASMEKDEYTTTVAPSKSTTVANVNIDYVSRQLAGVGITTEETSDNPELATIIIPSSIVNGLQSDPTEYESISTINENVNPVSLSRKDDYNGNSPFFIRLPGSDGPVPVFIQYEPVEINYVPINGDSDMEENDNLSNEIDPQIQSLLQENLIEIEENYRANNVTKNNETLSKHDGSIKKTDMFGNTGESQIERNTSSSNIPTNNIYRLLDDATATENLPYQETYSGNKNSPSFTPNKPIIKSPDPFFVMEPPKLGSANEKPGDSNAFPNVNKNDNSYSNVRINQNKNDYSIDVSGQYGFGSSNNNNERPGTVEDVPVGVKQQILYPGDYYLHDSYTGVNLSSLVNPVFKLRTKATTLSPLDLLSPQYTPFPITTNAPFKKGTSTQEAYVSSTIPTTTPSIPVENGSEKDTDTIDMPSINENLRITTENTVSTPSKYLPSIAYSPIPAVDFHDSYSPSFNPDNIFGNADSIIAPYISLYDNPSYIRGEEQGQIKDRTGAASNSDTYSTNPLASPEESFLAVDGSNSDNTQIPLDQFMAHKQVWAFPQSREDPVYLEEDNYRPVKEGSGKRYSAFYSPLDVPGFDPALFRYRQVADVPVIHNPTQPRDEILPAEELEEVPEVISQPANNEGLFSQEFFEHLNSLPYPLLSTFLNHNSTEEGSRITRSAPAEGDQIFCEWNIKTEPGLYLLMTFHNLSAAYTVDCHGAYIEVERENNGYDARWCGNRVGQAGTRPHVIFAKSEVRITVYDDGSVKKGLPTGFEADIEVIDLFNARDYNSFMRSNAYPHIRRLLLG